MFPFLRLREIRSCLPEGCRFRQTGYLLPVTITKNAEKDHDLMLQSFAGAWKSIKVYPKEIRCRDERTYALLKDFSEKTNVKVSIYNGTGTGDLNRKWRDVYKTICSSALNDNLVIVPLALAVLDIVLVILLIRFVRKPDVR